MNGRSILVRRASGLSTVQDAGRPGFMHLGVPPGGPLSPARFVRANRAVGNQPSAAALEVVGVLEFELECASSVRVSIDGEAPFATRDVRVTSHAERRVRYVAIEGGIDVPIVFGGRGTLLVAKLGGLEGRTLRAGDRLPLSLSPALRDVDVDLALDLLPDLDLSRDRSPIRVFAGPDLDAFPPSAVDALFASTFRVSASSDRVGTRLEGARLDVLALPPGARRASAPMVRGAIQVPPDGYPIVLGPDHPTTGGYPVIGVVHSRDVERIVAAPIGGPVRLCSVTS